MKLKPAAQNSHRLPWSSIREFFKGQWVELSDCEWEAHKAYPARARVRNFAHDRAELMSAIEKSGVLPETCVLFIGAFDSLIDHQYLAQSSKVLAL